MRISTPLGLRDGAASVTGSSLVGLSPVLRRKAFCHCTIDCLALGIRNLMCALGHRQRQWVPALQRRAQFHLMGGGGCVCTEGAGEWAGRIPDSFDRGREGGSGAFNLNSTYTPCNLGIGTQPCSWTRTCHGHKRHLSGGEAWPECICDHPNPQNHHSTSKYPNMRDVSVTTNVSTMLTVFLYVLYIFPHFVKIIHYVECWEISPPSTLYPWILDGGQSRFHERNLYS